MPNDSASLPRRAFLGAELAPDNEAFSAEGAKVVGVVAGGMAQQAGMQGGDTLVSLATQPMGSLRELSVALRRAGSYSTVELVFLRGSEKHVLEVSTIPCPQEAIPGQEVLYEELIVDGTRLRSIVSLPTSQEPRGAILFLQGIACESMDFGPRAEEPIAKLVHGWAQAGYLTMRVDKCGVGDSEGKLCAESDFHQELAVHKAALAALRTDPRAVGLDLFLFGHSVGGMVAPVLAAQADVAGIMVYGSSTKTWLNCVLDSTERQYLLRGLPAQEVAKRVGSLRETILHQGFNGRSAAYHRQLHALDLPAIWKRISKAKVVVLCGEHDWVLSREEQLEIATYVPNTTAIDLPGLDHMLGWHPDHDASMSAYGQGSFDPGVLVATLHWMQQSLP